MWMIGYNDGFDNMNMSNSFNRRNLLPQLFPKPALSITNNTSTTTPQACFSQFHPFAIAEQNKLRDELNTQQPQVVVSSRWNPTPEQLRALEELYRRGTRTPSADQIQNITAKLRRFGKIEGKNVFYWFQNHKARERQKRRRQIMESKPEDQQQEIIISEKKELLGTSMAILDEGQEQITKNIWVPSKNCTTLTEAYNDVSTQRVPKAGAESNRTDMLIQFGKLRDQLKNRRNSFMAKNSTWQMIHLSCPPPPSASTNNNNTHQLIINAPSTTTTTTTVRRTMTHGLIDLFNITPNFPQNHGFNYHEDHDQDLDFNNGGESDDQTLELFPLGSCGSGTLNEKDSNGGAINATASHPQQFFEFLPLKN